MKPLKSHSHTLPSSPIHHHHSSSSDFEFTTANVSPRKSITTNLRPADELFYNGQLLPLHLSPSNSMVYTTTTTTGRHSSDHHSSFSYDTADSSRHSLATEDHNHLPHNLFAFNSQTQKLICNQENMNNNFPFNRFSSVFRQETKTTSATTTTTITVKRMSVKAKEKIRKYLKKVKPLYEKLSQLPKTTRDPPPPMAKRDDVIISPSFPGNLRFLRRTSCVSSCPSTMPSSPSHSGVLCRKTIVNHSSSTEELQSAIQGAIVHCKNSMTQGGWKHK